MARSQQKPLDALKTIDAYKAEDSMLQAVRLFKGGIVPRVMEERKGIVDELKRRKHGRVWIKSITMISSIL